MHQGSQVTIKRVVWDLTYLISAVSTSERLTLGLSTFTGLHCLIAGVCRGFLRLLILSFSSSFRFVHPLRGGWSLLRKDSDKNRGSVHGIKLEIVVGLTRWWAFS